MKSNSYADYFFKKTGFKKNNAEKSVQYAKLRNAEKLYTKALQNAGAKYVHQKISVDREESNEYNKDTQFSSGKYSNRDINSVTQKEYEHHFWVIANNIITKKEIGILNDSISKIKQGEYFNQTSDGLYMIPVAENGIYNKIVFTDGKYESYSIDKVITINSDNETDLEIIRSRIYESERKGIHAETKYIFQVYVARNYAYSGFDRKGKSNLQNSNGERNGRRSDGEIETNESGDVKFSRVWRKIKEG